MVDLCFSQLREKENVFRKNATVMLAQVTLVKAAGLQMSKPEVSASNWLLRPRVMRKYYTADM